MQTWALGELWADVWVALVKSAFPVHCVIKRIVDRAPRLNLYARTRLQLWLPKVR